MKNTFLKTIGMATAFLMLMFYAQTSVSAQNTFNEENLDKQTQEEDLSNRRANTRKLEGVWNIQVTGRNCVTGDVVRTFPAMHTYMRGGTLTDWGSGTAPSLRGVGMGVWNYEGGRRYTTTFQFFRFNPDGTLAGKQIGRAELELSRFGSTFTTVGTGQILDVNGNVIQTACNTSTATRFE